MGEWIDSFLAGHKRHKDEVVGKRDSKVGPRSMGRTKVEGSRTGAADGNARHYLSLAPMAFPSTQHTYCCTPTVAPRAPRDLAASRCPFSTAGGRNREGGGCILPKVFSLSPRCEMEISAFRGLFMPANNAGARSLHTLPN